MSEQVGVWIDHRRAVVVKMTSDGEQTIVIESHAEDPYYEGNEQHLERPNYSRGVVVDRTQERKFESRLNDFYDEVIRAFGQPESLLILGPGEAKGQLEKRLRGSRPAVHLVDLETADSMTDPQVTAHVREYFKRT